MLTVPSDSAGASALHDTVLTAVGGDIAAGVLSAGHVITLDGISVQYGVSRSLAREVIRVLESMGMVAARRRIGITIQPAAAWNVFDPRLIRWRLASPDRQRQLTALTELRRGFEPVAAALAASRAHGGPCRELAGAVSDMQMALRCGDVRAYEMSDNDFHRILLSACGNYMFQALGALTDHRPGCVQTTAVVDAHDAVARAVRRADGGAAEQAMREIADMLDPAQA